MSNRDRCASAQTALKEMDIIEPGAHSLPLEYLLSPARNRLSPFRAFPWLRSSGPCERIVCAMDASERSVPEEAGMMQTGV
jgi:hypothetical protein